MSISPLHNPIPLPPAPPLDVGGMGSSAKVGSESFQSLLVESLREVNAMQQDAQQAVEQLSTGETN